jgi:hypothetical protein
MTEKIKILKAACRTLLTLVVAFCSSLSRRLRAPASTTAIKEPKLDEALPVFYTNRETAFVYEVQLFEDFALIRLACPSYQPVQKIGLQELADDYEEFQGNPSVARAFINGYYNQDVEAV